VTEIAPKGSPTMQLYVYDHCPFCVKARSIFGLTDTPLELAIILNDDAATPTAMIGRKMAPILDRDGAYIGESMDIAAHIDALSGGGVLSGPRNPQVSAWIEEASATLYRLAMPRWAAAPLAEFATPSARAFFTRNKEAIVGPFADRLGETDALVALMDERLAALAGLIRSPDAVNGTVSEDDIHLFATSRALSIVRGITYPAAVEDYRRAMAARMRVDLHNAIAA